MPRRASLASTPPSGQPSALSAPTLMIARVGATASSHASEHTPGAPWLPTINVPAAGFKR